jgi:hypothetical protein
VRGALAWAVLTPPPRRDSLLRREEKEREHEHGRADGQPESGVKLSQKKEHERETEHAGGRPPRRAVDFRFQSGIVAGRGGGGYGEREASGYLSLPRPGPRSYNRGVHDNDLYELDSDYPTIGCLVRLAIAGFVLALLALPILFWIAYSFAMAMAGA